MATHYHLLVADLVCRLLYPSEDPHIFAQWLSTAPWHEKGDSITLDLVLWIVLY